MDPGTRRPGRVAQGLPRARGDGPGGVHALLHHELSPPRPRGWTLGGELGRSLERVSPAPAGMDPIHQTHPPLLRRLPRARGGGPCVEVSVTGIGESPPRPRGWTPTRRSSTCAPTGLPRARGDGPWPRRPGTGTGASPPRPRGWTLHHRRAGQPRHVSPAPAGMDPPHSRRPPRSRRLPRARGDGPKLTERQLLGSLSPPRPRGWTLHRRELDLGRGVSPRARGDGPYYVESNKNLNLSPPRPRGWTPRPPRVRQRAQVSPAPAGMDPWPPLPALWHLRLPRARGDGPRPASRRTSAS